MKILREGKVPNWKIEKECTGEGNGGNGCTALLLIDEDDIYITTSKPYYHSDHDLCFKSKL